MKIRIFSCKNSDGGYLSIIVLTLMIFSFLLLSPINLRTYLVYNLIKDEKNFVSLNYKCDKGLIWGLEKAKEKRIDKWDKKVINILDKNNIKTIVSVELLKNGDWVICSKTITLDKKYCAEKKVVINYYLGDKDLNIYKIKEIK